MSGAAAFQGFIDAMLGTVGQLIGSQYAAYRITAKATGDFPTGWVLLPTQLLADRNRVTSGNIESNLASQRTLWYEIAGDVSAFLLGDVFVRISDTAGVNYMPGTTEIDAMVLASHAPVDVPIGARVDRRAGVYRASLAPGIAPDASAHWQITRDQATPLILTNGVYGWGTPGGVASWVPVGFGSNDRQARGSDFPPDTIAIPPTPRAFIYVPPLPGYTPTEGDTIITEDGSRYTVISPYLQETGVVGSQLLAERHIAQVT